jgi:SAM-dependent methyltransferase
MGILDETKRVALERLPRVAGVARAAQRRVAFRGGTYECPVCEHTFGRWKVPEGKSWQKICPWCDAHPRHRLIWLWLVSETDLFATRKSVLHVAPEKLMGMRLRSMENLDYVSADIASPLADVWMDLTRAPWPDASFDVIFCNHVLEHIPDDRAAMAELVRLLRPGGWAVLLAPFWPERETIEDPSASPEERLRRFMQEDHVRLYGSDYPVRLKEAGFEVEHGVYADRVGPELAARYGLQADESLVVGRKRGPAPTG